MKSSSRLGIFPLISPSVTLQFIMHRVSTMTSIEVVIFLLSYYHYFAQKLGVLYEGIPGRIVETFSKLNLHSFVRISGV